MVITMVVFQVALGLDIQQFEDLLVAFGEIGLLTAYFFVAQVVHALDRILDVIQAVLESFDGAFQVDVGRVAAEIASGRPRSVIIFT